MRPQTRTLLAIVFGLPLLIILPIAFLGASVMCSGNVEVHVVEKGGAGETVDVCVPAALLPAVVRLTPVCAFASCHLDRDARRGLRAASAMLDAMEDAPDGVYVDVRTRDEVVFVEKRNRVLRVEVDTPDEVVRVSAPLKAVRLVVRAI